MFFLIKSQLPRLKDTTPIILIQRLSVITQINKALTTNKNCKTLFINPCFVCIVMTLIEQFSDSKDFSVFISRISPDDDLAIFLKSKGIKARNQHPPMNASHEILESLKDLPPMYVFAVSQVPVLIAALKAYAVTNKKRLIIRKLDNGAELDLTNYSVKEIKELGIMDVFSFNDENETEN